MHLTAATISSQFGGQRISGPRDFVTVEEMCGLRVYARLRKTIVTKPQLMRDVETCIRRMRKGADDSARKQVYG